MGQDEAPLRFGTSGWRGVLGEDVTLPRLRVAVRAVADWVLEQAPPGAAQRPAVVVGFDTRFLSERMAAAAAGALAARGLTPLLARQAIATPVVAHAVRRRAAAAGLVFTASHNPPEYHGLKVLGPWGGSIGDDHARRIEQLARDAGELPGEELAEPQARRVDLLPGYARDLLRRLDRPALRAAPLRVVYDAMHGAGAGALDLALARAGAEVRVLRGRADPRFGGVAPDPSPQRLRALAREVRAGRGLRLGLATDGDADRFGAVDADGRMLSEAEALALLVDHLARTGRLERGVAISLATGSLVERVARSWGLPVSRHPIGFKHLAGALRDGAADAAGDECGGFAFAGLGCDKDGILAGCLLAELVASRRAPLRAQLAELERRVGRVACGRAALPARPPIRDRLDKLLAAPPARVDGCAVRSVDVRDGLWLGLDDGFVMLRESGTEPLVRIYAEARGPRLLRRRLAAGEDLLDAGA